MIHIEEETQTDNLPILDLGEQLVAVQRGRDVLLDLFFHERDRRPFLASTLAVIPGEGLKRVQYVCLATDEEAARAAVTDLVGEGYVHIKPLTIPVMSRDCTVVDINSLNKEAIR